MARHLPCSAETVVARKDNFLAQPLPLGIAGLTAAAMMGVFAWGFSILDGRISELRAEDAMQFNSIRQSINALAESSLETNQRIASYSLETDRRIASYSLETNRRIDSLATEIAVTNAKLDDLIAATKERKR